GFSVLTGQFNEERWEYYNDFVDVNFYQEKIHHTGLYVNTSFTYKWKNIAYTSIEIDIPIGWKVPNNVVLFKTEIAINF
ncbi:MAG: hypothetical protein GQ525_03805, partial [Draconibacterium sp.]|nr:hypothetical protein [Draconibacterium sp.]